MNLDFDLFDTSMDTSCLMDDSIETDSEYDRDEFDLDCDLNWPLVDS